MSASQPSCRPGPQDLAEALINRFGSLTAVVGADHAELVRVAGMDADLVAQLKRIQAFSVRLARIEAARRSAIASWTALVSYARTALAGCPREQLRVLFLDKRNVLMVDEVQATGTVDHAPVYVREITRRALEISASAMILVHNHPSGDPTPSQADIAMTRQIVEAARVFGIQVHDHLVVGREGTASFRALGLI
ncbi:RadC family protein [Brevundimonas sp.]